MSLKLGMIPFLISDVSVEVDEEGWRGATWQEMSGSEGAQISMSSKGTKIKGIFGGRYLIKILSPAIEKSNVWPQIWLPFWAMTFRHQVELIQFFSWSVVNAICNRDLIISRKCLKVGQHYYSTLIYNSCKSVRWSAVPVAPMWVYVGVRWLEGQRPRRGRWPMLLLFGPQGWN